MLAGSIPDLELAATQLIPFCYYQDVCTCDAAKGEKKKRKSLLLVDESITYTDAPSGLVGCLFVTFPKSMSVSLNLTSGLIIIDRF